jgi:hypothetical protein
MVYICYIIYMDYVITCVLTVGDDELAVRDDDGTLLEVAGGRAHVRVPRELTWMGNG